MARSAPYILVIVALVTAIMGALVLTVTDPVMQHLFDSVMWQSDTEYGQDALQWQQHAWNFWPAFILFGILMMVWVDTRRPG